MDAPAFIARGAVASLVHFESLTPAEHPSAALFGRERLGVGVAVAPDRVLTAHYLVMGASEVSLTGADGRTRPVVRVAVDHQTGLAMLSLGGEALRPAALGGSMDVRVGEPIFVLSSTAGHERRGATGHVSAVGPFEAFWEYMLDRAIMTTVINPGLAGAPLFDAAARLIGVVSLGLTSVGRYSLAIPVELYLESRESLEAGEGGRERRAWVGFFPQVGDGGILISGVVPGGPADRAGVVRGDWLISVAGQPVSTLRTLYRDIWKRVPGEPLGIQVLRESRIHSLEIVTADRAAFFR